MAESTNSLGNQTAPGDMLNVASLTVEEVSAALVTLLNGRPTLPSLEEIRAIVARHQAASPAAREATEADRQLVAVGAMFDELVAKLKSFADTEEDLDAIPEAVDLEDNADRLARQIIELPASSTAGRRVKARAFVHYNQGMVDRKIGTDDIVLASLLRDVLCGADDASEKESASS